MSFQYTGSQFQGYSNHNIDPYLLGISGDQASEARLNPSTEHFEHDVETATRTPDPTIDGQSEILHNHLSAETPDAFGLSPNHATLPFRSSAAVESPLSGSRFRQVRNRRPVRNLQTPLVQRRPIRANFLQPRTRGPTNWQSNNRFALLDDDPSTPPSGQHEAPQPHNDLVSLDIVATPYNPFWTPPSTDPSLQHAPVADGAWPPALGQSRFDNNFSTPMNRATALPAINTDYLPMHLPQPENLNSWNQGTYSIGDRSNPDIMTGSTLAPSHMRGRRTSRPPSVSTVHTLTCEMCGKLVKKSERRLAHTSSRSSPRKHTDLILGTINAGTKNQLITAKNAVKVLSHGKTYGGMRRYTIRRTDICSATF